MENGEDVATCPSCSLIIKVIYDKVRSQVLKWLRSSILLFFFSYSFLKPLRQLCRKQFETPELDAKVLPGTDVMSGPFLAIAS